jgi:anhydro-N-acetylmuramic acid kinase
MDYVSLGLMSGTSLDGVDAAFLYTDGERIHEFGPSLCIQYSPKERLILEKTIQSALKWNFIGQRPSIFEDADNIILKTHKLAVEQLCETNKYWSRRLSLIGFHGQTVLHHPPQDGKRGQTLQLGDGENLAKALNFPVWYDFRSNDISNMGQGAPLAPIYHKSLALYSKLRLPTVILNIGGVSNLTLVSKNNDIIATDTGPGNGPIDNWIHQNGLGLYDPYGQYALAGKADYALVKKWLGYIFFKKNIPRSADRYDFDVINDIKNYSVEDGAATLVAFVVEAIAGVIKEFKQNPVEMIVCGGGRHNKAIISLLDSKLDMKISTTEKVGWISDAVEAQAFAYLAVRSQLGLPISFPTTTGVKEPLTGGKLSLPN